MIAEKTITICGKQVRMRYCAATETGFEISSHKSISVFSPTFGKDEEGKDMITEPAKATSEDYMYLASAAIVAAYSRNNEQAPITSEDILYDASPEEIAELLKTVITLRAEWYNVPSIVKPDMKPGNGKKKNAQPPTTSTKK